MAEPVCGVTCACLPTLRPLVAKYVPALSSRGGRSTTAYGRFGASSHSQIIDEEKARVRAVASSKERPYRTDDESGAEERWQQPQKASGQRGMVVTNIVANMQKPKPTRMRSDREIRVQREVYVEQDDRARGRI